MEKMYSNISNGLLIGDEATYIFLFREYYVSLCAYARRFVGRKDIAEEIVSDTFFKIWEHRSTLNIQISVKSYLFQAVCNNSLHYLRKLKNESKFEEYLADVTAENIALADPIEMMEEQSLIIQDFDLRIEEAISRLPEQQQKAFRLKRLEGYKIKEVAEKMGLSVKTVEMHLAKATIHLRENLKDLLPSFLLFILLK